MAGIVETTDSRGHLPEGKWTFDAAVTGCFDDMLGRSIPQYGEMRELCYLVARRYVQRDTDIVDLGCSQGGAMKPLIAEFGCYNRHVGVEVSEPMLEAARERYASLIETGVVEIRSVDLRHEFPPVRASVIQSVLTLQFIPIEYLQRVVQNVYQHLLPGGAFILVEKVLGATSDLDDLMVSEYLGMKARHGYSQEEIDRKRLSLEGVLVPVTAGWNEDLLHREGFSKIDCFWRWMNFAAWVALK